MNKELSTEPWQRFEADSGTKASERSADHYTGISKMIDLGMRTQRAIDDGNGSPHHFVDANKMVRTHAHQTFQPEHQGFLYRSASFSRP